MSYGEQGQSQATYRKPRSVVKELKVTVTISEGDVRVLLASLQRPIVEAVAAMLTKMNDSAAVSPAAPPPVEKAAVEKPTGWLKLSAEERLKAADLRTELLLGKVPDTAGLLIDTMVTAKLLNVSAKTVYRMDQVQAIPPPVRLGENIVRWRLAEILAWIDAGCPRRRNWTYPGDSQATKRRR